MNESASAKQQIVEKIKNSTNILVTVNINPTVDELTAALGLTMIINKLKKHSTAVVSGEIPPAIDFLEPGKTFENTVDSLRDFIIALDKEKADHLRYKVDGDVVKIFITPYRTTIGSDDLDFSQGDYNVELVLALNVQDRDNLDRALAAHGRILHDATVATISTGESSRLGSIDWKDSAASSLSEMLVALSESLKDDKPLLDEQVATALLTGIVAATDRFSNEKTSSRVMTMAAQLMAAGANQQLIAAKLEEAEAISAEPKDQPAPEPKSDTDGATEMNETESFKLDRTVKPKDKPKKSKNDGALMIDHQDLDDQTEPNVEPEQNSAFEAERQLSEQLSSVNAAAATAAPISVADLQADLKNSTQEINQAASEELITPQIPVPNQPAADNSPANESPQPLENPAPEVPVTNSWSESAYEETPAPTFGGTLNATTEAAAEAKRAEIEADRNKVILSHGGKGGYLQDESADPNANQNAINGVGFTEEPATVNPFAAAAEAAGLAGGSSSNQPPVLAPLDKIEQTSPTLADLDSQHRAKQPDKNDEARAAVEAAFGAMPFDPANQPQANLGAQPFGEVPHDRSQMPVDMPPLPPMPDFSTLPPLPPLTNTPSPASAESQPTEVLGDIFGSTSTNDNNQPVQAPEPPSDPTQFKIPGQ